MSTVFNSIISTLKYLFMCVGYNVKQSVNNKKSFIIQTIAMFINNFVFIFFWQILFNNKGGNINGIKEVLDDFNGTKFLITQNNQENNLELLCPNCHALTENFGSRNSNCTRIDKRYR